MYIESVKIKNYFSFDETGIALNNLSDKSEIYFVGENGVGKTILLQAIAMAIKGKQKIGATVDILKQNENKNPVFEAKIDNEIDLFGYGINRLSIKGLKGIDIKNEVYISLFDNSKNLTDFEYWLQMLELDRKYKKKNIKPNDVITLLSDFLDKKVEINFDGSNILFLENKTKVNFNQLSDGYRSSITWISDLLARLSNNQGLKNYSEYKAIVLVDEIGIYLHPKLKFELVKKLKKVFLNIQWFFTTHSPDLMLGAGEGAIAYKMYKEDGVTKISEQIEIKNYTANSLLTSNIWGLEKFYTQNTKPEFISDLDDINQKIYQVVQEKRKEKAHVSNNDLISLIEKEIEKEDNKKIPSDIKELAKKVKDKLANENHSLTKHIWGDYKNIIPNFNPKKALNWFPISIFENFTGTNVLYEIQRRDNNIETPGLLLNIIFPKDEKNKLLFLKFIDIYFDKEMKKRGYQQKKFGNYPRIVLQIKDKINLKKIGNDEIDLIYEGLKKFYSDWHTKMSDFFRDEKINQLFNF